jgi:hypothetical protein
MPDAWHGKNVFMEFGSTRMRTEVFVNNELVGYNLVDGTPFSINISDAANPGKNKLAVRITDPNGDFTWNDYMMFTWGKNETLPSKGFGGITGDVSIYAVGNSYIDDVYVKNKSSLKEVDVQVKVKVKGDTEGNLIYELRAWNKDEILLTSEKTVNNNTITQSIIYPEAKLWSPDSPNLYVLTVKLENEGETRDVFERRFGFRWFEAKMVNGDRMLFLNNKRIVLRTAISWGIWPVNGLYPTDELAKKQIQTAKDLGLNMLSFHRAIGQPKILNYADEMGLLYYEEPGGYRDSKDSLTQVWKREKLFRMVKRDRNHPSLVIYNMANEGSDLPDSSDYSNIQRAHELDETRFITYKSPNGEVPLTPAPIKLYMEPYNQEHFIQGWWDKHHAGGPGVYHDEKYNNPTDFYRHIDHHEEIIFYGEDGAIGTPGRMQLIKKAIENQEYNGWDGDKYLSLYHTYNTFLDKKGFRDAFPNVDSLTTSLGRNSHYYHGRIIENVRIANNIDGYAVNGWEETKVENHSGIVDAYRNPKTNPEIMAYYNQPLYVAIKARNKVQKAGESITADFFIVNEKDINGEFDLVIKVKNEGQNIYEEQHSVVISGGLVYGELLKDAVEIPVKSDYNTIHAYIMKGDEIIARGHEKIFGVDMRVDNSPEKITVMDTSGILKDFFDKNSINANLWWSQNEKPAGNLVVVGHSKIPYTGSVRQELVEWVALGNKLIVLGGADEWAEYFAKKEVLDYRGKKDLGILWYGGNFAVRDNPYFEGLPVNQAFNWEYQCFVHYDRKRFGLRLPEAETVVAAFADHKEEVFDAISIIPVGRGEIVISTLDIMPNLRSDNPSSYMAKRIVMNMIRNQDSY